MNLPLTLKIKRNLFVKNNTVISYTTPVAKIQDNQLIDLGKFSRTTGKHLAYIESTFQLNRVRSPKRKDFYWYMFGVNCSMENSLSAEVSKIFLQNLGNFDELIQQLSMRRKFSPKDWLLIKRFLESNGFNVETFQKLQRAHHLLQFV